MNKVTKLFLLALPLCIFTSCHRQDPISHAEDKDNGLRKEFGIGNMHYTIQYKPADYILASEHTDPGTAAARQQQLKGMAWFNISFSVNGYNQSPLRYQVAGLDEYTQRQDYYLNQAVKDIYLLYGSDTLYADSYWFENNQNLTPYETMIVGFRLPEGTDKPGEDLRLSYYDRVFKNGIIKTVIKKEDL